MRTGARHSESTHTNLTDVAVSSENLILRTYKLIPGFPRKQSTDFIKSSGFKEEYHPSSE